MTDNRLAKSIARYRQIINLPDMRIDPKNLRWQEAKSFLNALEDEFGRKAVDAERRRQGLNT